MQSFAEEMGNNLFVFNKSMITGLGDPNAPSTQIDDASPENLKKLIHFADSIVEENQQKLDTLCNLLVSSRDQKKNPSQKKSLLDRLIGKD